MEKLKDFFCNMTDKEICIIYEDIQKSKKEGFVSATIHNIATQINELVSIAGKTRANSEFINLATTLFYEEVAERFVKITQNKI
jgi:hypothetical protein